MGKNGKRKYCSGYSWSNNYNVSWKTFTQKPLFQFTNVAITVLSLASVALLIAVMAMTRVFGSGFEQMIADESFTAHSFEFTVNNVFLSLIVIAATCTFISSMNKVIKRVCGAHLLNKDNVDSERALGRTKLKQLGTERKNAAYAAYYSSHKAREVLYIVFECVFRVFEIFLCVLVVLAFSETVYLMLYLPRTGFGGAVDSKVITVTEWFIPVVFGLLLVLIKLVFYIVHVCMFKHWVRKNNLKSSIK